MIVETHIILILMIVGALAAVQIKSLLSSVIALGSVGMGLSLIFLFLGAPDLAITQLVVEILALVILIRATLGKDVEVKGDSDRNIYKLLGIAIFSLFVWLAGKAMIQLAPFGSATMKMGSQYIDKAISATSAVNTVASIILDFRGYDTLGEATILFTAVLGVLAILRNKK